MNPDEAAHDAPHPDETANGASHGTGGASTVFLDGIDPDEVAHDAPHGAGRIFSAEV
jgi:hypothetical protein